MTAPRVILPAEDVTDRAALPLPLSWVVTLMSPFTVMVPVLLWMLAAVSLPKPAAVAEIVRVALVVMLPAVI